MDSRAVARKFLELEIEKPSLNQLLDVLLEVKGSDLHLSCGSPVMMRVRSKMHPLKNIKVDEGILNKYIEGIISGPDKKIFKDTGAADFSFTLKKKGIFRVNVFKQHMGPALVIRSLPESSPSLKSLRMPSILSRALDYPNGLILVTGPTGSGKSTTLAAMLDHINRKKRGHIVTLEDPIEYLHSSKKCMVNQRAYNKDFFSFAEAITHAMREDPDYILVGEMRDVQTMNAALKAAETGHLVFSTLHTNSAAKTVDRILSSFPAGEANEMRTLLAETLRLVVSQKLIASVNGDRLQVFQDILVNTSGVQSLIRQGKTHQIENVMVTSKDEGMQLMDKRIRAAAEQGDIRVADAKEKVNDKNILEEVENFINKQPQLVEHLEDVYEKLLGNSDEEFNYEDDIDNPYVKTDEELEKQAQELKQKQPGRAASNGKQVEPVLGLKEMMEELKNAKRKPKSKKTEEEEISDGVEDLNPPPPPKKNLRGVEVRLERIVNDTFEFDKIVTKPYNILLFNFKDVRRISDKAIANFHDFLEKKKSKIKIKIKGLQPPTIKSLNKHLDAGYLSQFVIEDFYAPYYCGHCDLELSYLLEYGKDFHESQKPELPPDVTCSECHGEARLNTDEKYLKFLKVG